MRLSGLTLALSRDPGPPATGGGGGIATSLADLTGTQGANGWSGGVFTGGGSKTPTPSTAFSTAGLSWVDATRRWVGSESFTTPIVGDPNAHPGVTSKNSAVYRYTVPAGFSGALQVDVTARKASSGSVSVAIWHNDTLLVGYTDLSSTDTLYSATPTVAAGDHVYVELNCNGATSSDSSLFAISISG